jgi:von willebrand factor type A
MAAAKEALTGFLNDVPDNAPLGLMTYGTKTGSSDAEKAAGCKDVTLLSAPGQRTAKSLVGDIQGITPRRLHTHWFIHSTSRATIAQAGAEVRGTGLRRY